VKLTGYSDEIDTLKKWKIFIFSCDLN